MSANPSLLHILLVEDSRADAKIIERALREANVPHRLTVLPDGQQALDFLAGLVHNPNAASHTPDLILLDLNLPGLDGHQVLSRLKSDPILRVLPVVVLTTSEEERDIAMCYQLHGNCFITKPVDMEQFTQVVRSIESFWFTIVRLPPNKG